MPQAYPTLAHRVESGRELPLLVWRFAQPIRAIASSPLGGGIGERRWLINATVDRDYDRLDPDRHLLDLAGGCGLTEPGAGMLTAVDVNHAVSAHDGGVTVTATVGLGHPTQAAAPDLTPPALRPSPGAINPGTINVVALVPAGLSDAALVNAVATATEAKVQALRDSGVEATGTATDAILIGALDGATEPFGGPRSTWGARLARAVYSAILEGTGQWYDLYPGRTPSPGRPSRP